MPTTKAAWTDSGTALPTSSGTFLKVSSLRRFQFWSSHLDRQVPRYTELLLWVLYHPSAGRLQPKPGGSPYPLGDKKGTRFSPGFPRLDPFSYSHPFQHPQLGNSVKSTYKNLADLTLISLLHAP